MLNWPNWLPLTFAPEGGAWLDLRRCEVQEYRQQLDLHRAHPMFDRSSFTRYRILRSSGSWNGADPGPGVGA